MIRIVLLATIVVVSFASAGAQPLSGSASSVELLAADSCSIVRAVIEDVSVHAMKDGFERDAGVHRYQTVSVRVLETLKGAHSDRLQFVCDGDFGAVRLSDLQRDKQEVLLFLNHWTRSRSFDRASGGYAVTRFPLVVEYVAILTSEDVRFAHTTVPPLTANLTKLSTPKELIGAIQTYLKTHQHDAPVRRVSMQLPERLRGGYYQVAFTFPADAAADDAVPAAEEPVVDFATFKKRPAEQPPTEKKPPYTRDRGGYIGVYALEWMAADCDVIVRGVIEDSCFVAASNDPTGPSYGVKLRVLQTLKGEAAEQVNVYITDSRDVEQLQRDRQEVVLFLRSRLLSGPAAALGYQSRGALWDDSVIVLYPRDAEVLFADLTWHRDPEEILARLRAVANRKEKQRQPCADSHATPPIFDAHPPMSIVAGASIAGNQYAVIYLPVDTDLEANARKWAAAENKDMRWLAARAMVYFKSDENAAILKGMVHDEATWERGEMLRMTGLAYPHEPEFLVRWEAWHVLTGWGYDVAKPVFATSRQTSR